MSKVAEQYVVFLIYRLGASHVMFTDCIETRNDLVSYGFAHVRLLSWRGLRDASRCICVDLIYRVK